jgi:uncharacterized Zn finger protein
MPGHETPELLLTRFNVTILSAGRRRMEARVSDAGAWTVKRRGDRWACTCPVVGPCTHILAVATVADMPIAERKRAGGV